MRDIESVSLIIGATFSIVFFLVIFFGRSRRYAIWAKVAAGAVGIAGVSWGVLGFVLMLLHTSMPRPTYFVLGRIKTLLGGIAIGLLIIHSDLINAA